MPTQLPADQMRAGFASPEDGTGARSGRSVPVPIFLIQGVICDTIECPFFPKTVSSSKTTFSSQGVDLRILFPLEKGPGMRKRSTLMMVVATLLVVVVAATAEAQRQGGRQGGRGGPGGRGPGGQGGPGMMMGRGGFGGFGGGSLLMLARNPAVQKEIEALDEQVEKINALAEDMRPQRGPRGGEEGERPNFREMSEEERTKFFEEMRKEREKQQAEADKKLGEILLDMQMDRLKEIQVQQMGLRALQDEEVAAKLKITADQKAKMQKVMEESGQKMREEMQAMFQNRDRENVDRDAMREKMTELREKIEKDVMAVLTSAQKKQFEEMKGEPFEMPRPEFGGRGGRGERDGQDGGGNRPRRPGV
jgi:hypothetical protein